DQSDCGVACLLSLIQYHGGEGSLETLRKISGTTKQGTTLLGLYQAADKLGFKAEGCEADIDSLIDHGEPVILHILIDKRLKHFVVCYGFENDEFIIGDPVNGIKHYSTRDLEEIWQSKICLTLLPGKGFKKAVHVERSKKQWFLKLLKEDYALLRISLGLGLGMAILGMAMATFSQKLIDDILPSQDYGKLVTGIVLVGFLLLVRVGFTVLRDYFLIRQSKDFNNRIIDNFFGSLLHLPKPFFDTRKIGELVARLNDTRRIQRVIRTVVGSFGIDALVVLVSFVFLFYYSWETGLISLFCLPFYFWLLYRFNAKIINAQKDNMQGYAHSESNFISTIQGIATIKNNNQHGYFQDLNKTVYGNFQEKSFKLGLVNVRLSLLSSVFSVVFLIIVLTFNAFQVFNDKLMLGELMAILGVAGSLLPSIANLALVTIPINEAKIAFNRMFEFTTMKKEDSGLVKLEEFTSLEIESLSFRFPGRSQLLTNINLKVSRGECIAVIGESGSGKSTLAQIVQQFYPFESGSITLNESHRLGDVDLENWRSTIGVVPQDIHVFDGNVLDNIVLGQKDAYHLAVQFCKSYGFDQFFMKLPQGYGTLLGENGINLSGGQKQLIGFARALFRDPAILLLDESTGAMDRNTERFIMDILHDELMAETSILMITHRLNNINTIADRIYILDNGETVNSGTHEQLLQTSNFYSIFWNDVLMPFHKNGREVLNEKLRNGESKTTASSKMLSDL
ncbi:MAG: peptidase domain-containing ABC transporter, partial [Maribacter sp.]|nr:peptidase domain-containing ABC transporter [Maribacter sp.]